MIVAYYTSTFFMDVMLETIQTIKNKVELHVFIEISENSKNATLVNIKSINNFNFIERPETVLGEDNWKYFKPYFEGVKSVNFVVFKNKKSFSIETILNSYKLGKYLRNLKISVFHFDNVSQRSLGLYPFIRKVNTCISIHDSISHTGEENWRDKLVNKVFYKKAKGFIFYSTYSLNEFRQHYNSIKTPLIDITLLPYTFIRNFIKKTKPETILFFGRISYYKGIDILIDAIPQVLKTFPDQKFVIAGTIQYNYIIKNISDPKLKSNLIYIEKYLTIEEIAEQISNAKFIVCPYREATQSGVLMTAFASEKTVIASDVGSFKEYISNGKNGILCLPNPDSLAYSIINALENENYKLLQSNLTNDSNSDKINSIGDKLFNLYNSFKTK